MNANRILQVLSRGSTGGNRSRRRRGGRPRGEGMGLIDTARRLLGRR
jgi:hypothetical protein